MVKLNTENKETIKDAIYNSNYEIMLGEYLEWLLVYDPTSSVYVSGARRDSKINKILSDLTYTESGALHGWSIRGSSMVKKAFAFIIYLWRALDKHRTISDEYQASSKKFESRAKCAIEEAKKWKAKYDSLAYYVTKNEDDITINVSTTRGVERKSLISYGTSVPSETSGKFVGYIKNINFPGKLKPNKLRFTS